MQFILFFGTVNFCLLTSEVVKISKVFTGHRVSFPVHFTHSVGTLYILQVLGCCCAVRSCSV